MILNEFTNSTFYLEDSGDEDAVAAAEVDSTTIFTELGIDNSAGKREFVCHKDNC